jgi:translation initiation factor IF-2
MEAGPSVPVEVLGLPEVPHSGDILEQVESDKIAREIVAKRRSAEAAEQQQRSNLEQMASQIGAGEVSALNIIIKADVHGSLEALRSSAERLGSEQTRINILHANVGSITESDVLLASASDATIFGFQTRIETAARRLANVRGVEIRNYAIIYQFMDDLGNALRGIAAPILQEVIEGRAEVRQIFEMRRNRIAGCMVVEGRIRRGALTRLKRGTEVIYEGPLDSLRHFRDEVREVATGQECGIGLKDFLDFAEGDVIETFRQEEQPAQ